MSEYIDKWCVVNRLIDLENKFQRLKPFHGNEQSMYEKICELEIFLGKSLTVDVAPIAHGKWIEKSYLLGISNFCSKCGENFGMPHGKFNFCPNCGAKMDLEDEQ